jgi:hypothetical protein
MIETLKLIVSLLPLLIQLVKAAEQAAPESGQGAVKLEMVRQILLATDEGIAAIWPIISKAIAAIVATLNAVRGKAQ